MANSSCVSNWKNQILSDLQNDNEIIEALNLHEDDDHDDLVWSRLFPIIIYMILRKLLRLI